MYSYLDMYSYLYMYSYLDMYSDLDMSSYPHLLIYCNKRVPLIKKKSREITFYQFTCYVVFGGVDAESCSREPSRRILWQPMGSRRS